MKPILVVEDDAAMRELLDEQLKRRGFEVTAAASGADALGRFEERDFDAVLTDLNMKGMSGIELCRQLLAKRPEVPVLVLTAFGSLDAAMQAIRAGAWDFITKPVEMEALAVALNRALEHRALKREVRRLRDAAKGDDTRELTGSSESIRRVRELIARVADSDASVLINGESGTGKEVGARALHRLSRRAKGPLVAINCAAVPAQLLESELFGYMKGAFTDARADRVGVFKQADGGTLVLDEVGELPLALQPKLLRALQERTVRPLGASAEETFDARIVSVTNVDLEERVAEGQFREDLFYRLNVITLTMPPLRARAQDLLELAQDFITKAAQRSGKAVRGLTPEAAKKLLEYDWPGNVRELENSMERAVAFTTFDHVLPDDLPERVRAGPGRVTVAPDETQLSMETVERRHVMRVLEAHNGNRTRAARVLGLDRKTLQRKLERWGSPPGATPDE
jgi:two-component system response regulator HydG